jgi:plastocyanin domain-containing protein
MYAPIVELNILVGKDNVTIVTLGTLSLSLWWLQLAAQLAGIQVGIQAKLKLKLSL